MDDIVCADVDVWYQKKFYIHHGLQVRTNPSPGIMCARAVAVKINHIEYCY